MYKRETQKYTARPRKMPVLLLRLLISAGLGALMHATLVPWAQQQRGYASLGGEYFFVLAAVAVPLLIFRR